MLTVSHKWQEHIRTIIVVVAGELGLCSCLISSHHQSYVPLGGGSWRFLNGLITIIVVVAGELDDEQPAN